MSRVLLVWSTYIHPDPEVNDNVEDHWTAHDSLSEAREAYKLLLKLPNLHSASACAVLQSTDYHPMWGGDFSGVRDLFSRPNNFHGERYD